MSDYYPTPYEASLTVVATGMKKSRLRIDVLVLNGLLGGTLFSAGSFMYLSIQCNDPDQFKGNSGWLDLIGGLSYGVSLFFVVITGADLFNSNVLYLTVAFLRRAVNIVDCFVILLVSLITNLGASLFVTYLFGYLSGIGRKPNWVMVSKDIVASKVSYSFIQTFLKAIAANFLVALAIFLQLLAKPIHVKLFVIILPISVIATVGFTHVVSDMVVMYLGMLNGGPCSVGKYIWKILIPGAIGNLIGGSVFGLVVPFYLQLIVVERDRKRLSLPEYRARDEQPELNVDSRVVRLPIQRLYNHWYNGIHPEFDNPEEEDELEALEEEEEEEENEELELEGDVNMPAHGQSANFQRPITAHFRSRRSNTSKIPKLKLSRPYVVNHSTTTTLEPLNIEVSHPNSLSDISNLSISHSSETISEMTGASSTKYNTPISATAPEIERPVLRNRKSKITQRTRFGGVRSPPGVFPVLGMADPLDREKTIENPNLEKYEEKFKRQTRRRAGRNRDASIHVSRVEGLGEMTTPTRDDYSEMTNNETTFQQEEGLNKNGFNALRDTTGAKIERALSHFSMFNSARNVIDEELGELSGNSEESKKTQK